MDEDEVFRLAKAHDPHLRAALLYGSNQTWIVEGEDEDCRRFSTHWAPFRRETLFHILKQGNRKERVCALFSIGHLGYEEDQSCLLEYLYSKDVWEQWASAIELWKRGEKQALPVLQALICDRSQMLIKLWHNPIEDPDNFAFWSVITKKQVINTFIQGKNAEVLPLFWEALHWCWDAEREFDDFLDRWDDLQAFLFSLEDTILYGLGCFRVWDASLLVSLPPGRLRIAQFLWTLGSLHAHEHFPYMMALLSTAGRISMIPGHLTGEFDTWLASCFRPKKTQASPMKAKFGFEQIQSVLSEQFGRSSEEQAQVYEQFTTDCDIRVKEAHTNHALSAMRKIWLHDFSLTGIEPEAWKEVEGPTLPEDFDLSFDPFSD